MQMPIYSRKIMIVTLITVKSMQAKSSLIPLHHYHLRQMLSNVA
jgi:hypothetical protein